MAGHASWLLGLYRTCGVMRLNAYTEAPTH